VRYESIDDEQALRGFDLLCRHEGIIPALESAHAVAYAVRLARRRSADQAIVVNLSGRGDKDLGTVAEVVAANGSSQ
jgi:tryptophan synthase beta chain